MAEKIRPLAMFPDEFGKMLELCYETFHMLQAMLMTDSSRRLRDIKENCRHVVNVWDSFKFKFHRHKELVDQPYTSNSWVLARDLEKEVHGIWMFLKYRVNKFRFEELESLQRNFAALIMLIDPTAPPL